MENKTMTLQEAMDNTAQKMAEAINTSCLPYAVLKLMLSNIMYQLDIQAAQAQPSNVQTGENKNAESES